MDTPPPAPPPAAPASAGEDKTVAIVSYLTIIGFIIALILHGQKKTQLGAFHLRQMLGMIVSWVAVGIVMLIPILGWIVGLIASLMLIVFWIMGLVSAAQGQQKAVPVVGEHFQKWFAGTFA